MPSPSHTFHTQPNHPHQLAHSTACAGAQALRELAGCQAHLGSPHEQNCWLSSFVSELLHAKVEQEPHGGMINVQSWNANGLGHPHPLPQAKHCLRN